MHDLNVTVTTVYLRVPQTEFGKYNGIKKLLISNFTLNFVVLNLCTEWCQMWRVVDSLPEVNRKSNQKDVYFKCIGNLDMYKHGRRKNWCADGRETCNDNSKIRWNNVTNEIVIDGCNLSAKIQKRYNN